MAINKFSKMTKRGRSYGYFSKTFDFSQIFEISREKNVHPTRHFLKCYKMSNPMIFYMCIKWNISLKPKQKFLKLTQNGRSYDRQQNRYYFKIMTFRPFKSKNFKNFLHHSKEDEKRPEGWWGLVKLLGLILCEKTRNFWLAPKSTPQVSV